MKIGTERGGWGIEGKGKVELLYVAPKGGPDCSQLHGY